MPQDNGNPADQTGDDAGKKETGLDDLKKEMQGNWQNLSNQVNDMNKNMGIISKALLEQREQASKKPAEEDKEDLGKLSAEQFEERLLKKAEDKAVKHYQTVQENQSKIQGTLTTLTQKYPEIAQTGSDMNKKMVEIHANLAQHLQNTPEGYEMAALRAAAETGTLPADKRRKSSTDDFVFGPGGDNESTSRQPKTKSLSRETVLFAQLMKEAGANIDIDNKDTVKRMEQYNARNFSRYR